MKQSAHVIAQLAHEQGIIKWPSTAETDKLVCDYNFPGGFAAVDGCHVPIKVPIQHADSYINRKSFASVVLQATCTKNLQFIDVSTGWPGSMHDARIYRKSKLHKLLNSGVIQRQYHVLGDSAYPLELNLMVPYRDNGHLSENQKKFNSRCSIERAFALFKGKFRRLKYLDINDLSAVPNIILAACTLHNFILQNDGGAGDEAVTDENVTDVTAVTEACATAVNGEAAKKRNELASSL